jgi:hypothetical protein
MDDQPEIEDCVTMAQFNELRQNIEERANGLANDLQAILHQVQHIHHVAKNASNHEDDVEETAEEATERVAREQQERRQRVAFHARRHAGRGRGDGGNRGGRGRGRGRGQEDNDYAEFEGEYEEEEVEQPPNYGRRRRYNYECDRPNEERFGKLKFTIPKFDGGSDPETYLTWELKVDKNFRLHNYSEEKKMAMVAVEFDDYALISWEQMLNDREEVGQGTVRTWPEMKREMRARFVPRHHHRDLASCRI